MAGPGSELPQRQADSLRASAPRPGAALLAMLAAVAGAAAWRWLWPWPAEDPVLALIGLRSPLAADLIRWGYAVACVATPCFATLFGATLAGLLVERRRARMSSGAPAPWPAGEELRVVVGELHRRSEPCPSPRPGWLVVPRRGLHTGTAVFGAVGSGKTSCCMYPFARQVLAWHEGDAALRPGGLVMEVKGDFCFHVQRILSDLGRAEDYTELSLDGQWCYNPLESDLDAYSLAYQVASLLNQLFGKGKEPFWQQASTNLVKFLILLYRITDGYVTLRDVYRTALDERSLQTKIDAARQQFDYLPQARLAIENYKHAVDTLPDAEWHYDQSTGEMFAKADSELVLALTEQEVEHRLQEPEAAGHEQRALAAIITWHTHDWSNLDRRLRSSIVEGVSVFLSLFDEPPIADVFCPPKSAYEQDRPHRGRWALPPLPEALEDGKVIALNLPIGDNPALGRAVGVMLKQDFQRSVLARIPRMEAAPDRPWRDLVFVCDEYHNFATVGEGDPGGDEKFFSLSRQAQLVALVATQSISSLRSALPGESWRTLLQTFRTRIFLTLSDEDSCKQASEACGQVERLKEQYSISESSQAGVGLLSGRAGGGKGSFGVTKSYSVRREPRFSPAAFAELRNAQAIVTAYDGRDPLPPTYCYLKPWYLPAELGYFEALEQGRI